MTQIDVMKVKMKYFREEQRDFITDLCGCSTDSQRKLTKR